jgi:hypothetical protein
MVGVVGVGAVLLLALLVFVELGLEVNEGDVEPLLDVIILKTVKERKC